MWWPQHIMIRVKLLLYVPIARKCAGCIGGLWRLNDAEGERHQLLPARRYLFHWRSDQSRLPRQWIFGLSTCHVRNRSFSWWHRAVLRLPFLIGQLLLTLTILFCLLVRRADESTPFNIRSLVRVTIVAIRRCCEIHLQWKSRPISISCLCHAATVTCGCSRHLRSWAAQLHLASNTWAPLYQWGVRVYYEFVSGDFAPMVCTFVMATVPDKCSHLSCLIASLLDTGGRHLIVSCHVHRCTSHIRCDFVARRDSNHAQLLIAWIKVSHWVLVCIDSEPALKALLVWYQVLYLRLVVYLSVLMERVRWVVKMMAVLSAYPRHWGRRSQVSLVHSIMDGSLYWQEEAVWVVVPFSWGRSRPRLFLLFPMCQ